MLVCIGGAKWEGIESMKKIRRSIAVCIIFCLATGILFPYIGVEPAKAAEALSDGLAGYWKFDGETQQDQLKNSALESDLQVSKNGSGAEILQAGGVSGGTVYFSKQENSFVKIDLNEAGMGLNAKNQDFSIMAWVKFDEGSFSSNSDKVNLFQQSSDSSDTNAAGRTILYYTSDQKLGTYLTGSDVVCDRQLALGEWNHIAFTSSHSTKKAQFYINGRLAKEGVLTGDFVDAATDIMIGAHKNPAASSAMKGSVDELRYYNKIISADAVQAIFEEFGQDIETETLKEQLRQQIADAKALEGGSEEAKEELLTNIRQAEVLLERSDASFEQLEGMINQLISAVEAYKKTVIISIEVDTSKKLRDIPDAMFGINHRYHNDGYSSWNAQEGKIEEEFQQYVKEASFGSIRYPGGTVSNLYDWKRAIGPLEDRKKTIHGNLLSPITPNFGVDEAMGWIYDDLDAEAVWVYAMGQGSAEDAADLFEYLNAPADGDATNPNGGTDWAEVRAANGHPEPYGVTRFEIGNEMGLWGQNYWLSGGGSSDYNAMARAYVNGGEMAFTKQNTVQEEDWRDAAANSDGSPNQVRYARFDPVVPQSASVYVNNVEWRIVPSLEECGNEAVCEFDEKTGRITFGDGVHGSIPPSGQAIKITYLTMQDGFVAYYDRLKEIAKELGMEVFVYSCMERPAAITELKNAGNKYDGAVIHPYSETSGSGGGYINISETDPLFYEKLLGRSLEHNISRVEELIASMGEGKVPVVSEFGIYRHNSAFIRSIGHAIYIANEMIDYIGLGTPYLNKHCLVDYPYQSDDLGTGSQCVIQAVYDENGALRFVSTPSAKAFSIFNNMTGNEQVGQTLRGNETYYTFELNGGSYEVPAIKALSTKDEEGNVFVTAVNNRKNDPSLVEIKIDGRNLDGEQIEVWQLTSEGVEDENTIAEPSLVDVEKSNITAAGHSLNATLAPHSVTSFKIPAKKKKVTVTAEEGGSVSGSLEAKKGSKVTVTAYPKEGYEFAGWYRGQEKVSEKAEYVFTVMEDVALTARFKKKEQDLKPGAQNNIPPKPDASGNNEDINYAAGSVVKDEASNGRYKVTSVNAAKGTVTFLGTLRKGVTKYVVPDTVKVNGADYKVTVIGAGAFKNDRKLKTVTIGKNVTDIREKAFYKTTSLTKLTIPASVKKIGKQAFYGDKNLKNIVVKTKKLTNKTVGKNAFKGIFGKVKIKVPSKKLKAYRRLLRARGVGAKGAFTGSTKL